MKSVASVLALALLLGLAGQAAPAPPPPAPPPAPVPDGFPTPEQRDGWVQLQDMPGVNIVDPDKAWTTPAVAAVLAVMGETALALGVVLQVNGVSGAVRGAENPPHVSHRWGRDLDIAYDFLPYPTEPGDPVDARMVTVLQSVAPYVERVGVNALRAAAFEGSGLTISVWAGHMGHLHLRLVKSLTAEP